MFPNAKILYCRRNPLDNLLSIYFQNFIARFSFSYQPADLGFLYRWHDWLMRQYLVAFPEQIMEVRYESLVANLPDKAGEILSWLGLPWDDTCLRYHESGRLVRTASWDQATRPLYTSSIGRYRHYLPWLQPVLATLGPRLAADHFLIENGVLYADALPDPPSMDFSHPLPELENLES